jgi:hypothetical protein
LTNNQYVNYYVYGTTTISAAKEEWTFVDGIVKILLSADIVVVPYT